MAIKWTWLALAAFGATALSGFAALAKKDEKPEPPAIYKELIECRGIADPTERLACFDREAAEFDQATTAGQVVVTDRETVKEARRGLFGFKLPSLDIFGGGDEEDEFTEIETTITTVSQFGYGSWRLTLADGAVWEQTDNKRLVFRPKSGSKVKIKEAAMGTFMASIDGQPGIRVRRVE